MTSYRLSFDGSRYSTLLQFHAALNLDLVSTLSSSTSIGDPDGSPAPPAKEHTDLRSLTNAKNDADILDGDKEDGITDQECSDTEIEHISLPKLKREILGADLIGGQVFLCCMPRTAVPVDQMHNMQDKSYDDRLNLV